MTLQKSVLLLALGLLLASCGPKVPTVVQTTVNASIDLVNVIDDKIMVSISPATITTDAVIFNIPETVPGTYSDDDYGQFIENFMAYTAKNTPLTTEKLDDNRYRINNAKQLAKVTYQVNDTYDIESEHEVFSPAGTNIKAGEQYMLNLHGILGYFDNQKSNPYYLEINRPSDMVATTSLPTVTQPTSKMTFANPATIDKFSGTRYFEIIDNPIMYAGDNKETFVVDGITIELGVYSPNGIVSASALKPNIERMMKAQKAYLGELESTDRYSILLYLSAMTPDDAKGFGALEHHTSTVVVLPEAMPAPAMDEAMIDVVAHEFFHIVTPLAIHSEEIHNFRYNDPKMSKHLWLYEGVTEYFAQHFQVYEKLVPAPEFYETLEQKIANAKAFPVMSFTEMSEKILDEPFASAYPNVYEKGALIGMSLDILMRENSNGERSLLSLMKELSTKYGKENPFEDNRILTEIAQMTYPAIGTFLTTHVQGSQPIDFNAIFKKVGLDYKNELVTTGYFLDGRRPYITANPETGEIMIIPGIELTTFYQAIGLEGGDLIKSINGTEYSIDNAYQLIADSNNWKSGDAITISINRAGEEMTLTGQVSEPKIKKPTLIELQYLIEGPELRLRKWWLYGKN